MCYQSYSECGFIDSLRVFINTFIILRLNAILKYQLICVNICLFMPATKPAVKEDYSYWVVCLRSLITSSLKMYVKYLLRLRIHSSSDKFAPNVISFLFHSFFIPIPHLNTHVRYHAHAWDIIGSLLSLFDKKMSIMANMINEAPVTIFHIYCVLVKKVSCMWWYFWYLNSFYENTYR